VLNTSETWGRRKDDGGTILARQRQMRVHASVEAASKMRSGPTKMR
jgi:hypothetical protein